MLIFSNGVSAQMSCKCDIVLFIYLTLAHRAYVNFRKLYPLCKNSSFPWSAKPGKYNAKLIFYYVWIRLLKGCKCISLLIVCPKLVWEQELILLSATCKFVYSSASQSKKNQAISICMDCTMQLYCTTTNKGSPCKPRNDNLLKWVLFNIVSGQITSDALWK